MAKRDLEWAGYLLFVELIGGTALTFALGQLGFKAEHFVFAGIFALNLVTAFFLARAARSQGRSALAYGVCSALPPGALWAFWRLREAQVQSV